MRSQRERFRLIRPPLGGGAFGVVFLADDLELKQQVAIKIPHDADKERALVHEAQLMARIRALHEPHVVALYDLHVLNDQRVMVMEYGGRSLRSLVGAIENHPHDPMKATEALDIGIQVCRGLEALHHAFGDAGIFHRDIKPENVLIREPDRVAKIADFGIARVLEASGCGSTTAGTPPYMSPELLDPDGDGYGADYRADVYSLGVTLYEMLGGRLPYAPIDENGRAKPPGRYHREICAGRCLPLAEIVPVDAALSEAVHRAIHRNVLERYQSVAELRFSLEAALLRLSIDGAIAAAAAEKDPIACERAYRELLQRFPRDPKAYRNVAWFYNSRGLPADAARVLEEARLACSPSSELTFELALTLAQLGERTRAVGLMEQACAAGLPPDLKQRASVLVRNWRK